jgi:hypothetical protein
MATIAVFIALGGGTAMAAFVVSSNSQVGPDTISGHHPPSGDHANIISGSVGVGDLALRARQRCLTGMALVSAGTDLCIDKADRATGQTWQNAASLCAGQSLRLPSVAEVLQAKNVLDANPSGHYWTDGIWNDSNDSGTFEEAWYYNTSLHIITFAGRASTLEVRCVANPTENHD